MKSVFELVAKHVEPSIKRQLVEALVERGVPRHRVAKCLGISTSLVTRYLKKERGLHDFSMFKDVSGMIDKLAEEIASGTLCGDRVYHELSRIVVYVLSRKYACGIHYAIDKTVNPAKCRICPELFRNELGSSSRVGMPGNAAFN